VLRKRVIFEDTFQEKDAFCIRKHKIQHSTFLDFVSHHLSFNFHGPSQVNLVIIAPQTTLFPLILARCTHGEIYFFQWWYHLPPWHTTITQHQYISLFSFPLPTHYQWWHLILQLKSYILYNVTIHIQLAENLLQISNTVKLVCAHPVHTFWNEQRTRMTALMHGHARLMTHW
jgi:hypothetical protein